MHVFTWRSPDSFRVHLKDKEASDEFLCLTRKPLSVVSAFLRS